MFSKEITTVLKHLYQCCLLVLENDSVSNPLCPSS